MDKSEMMEMMRLFRKLGEEVEIDEEDVQAYLPDISNLGEIRDFYLPKVRPGFYTGCFKNLRSLTLPRFRRMR